LTVTAVGGYFLMKVYRRRMLEIEAEREMNGMNKKKTHNLNTP
jgi:hypothetical protein